MRAALVCFCTELYEEEKMRPATGCRDGLSERCQDLASQCRNILCAEVVITVLSLCRHHCSKQRRSTAADHSTV